MELETCRFGDDEAEAAFHGAGCTSMLDFLFSPPCQQVSGIMISPSELILFGTGKPAHIMCLIRMEGLRAREEGREAGSFVRFLRALPTSLPSCTRLIIHSYGNDAEFVLSEPEASALFHAIASPDCTFKSLILLGGFKIASDREGSLTKRIVRETLLAASTSTLQSLEISMDLCSQEDLAPFLARTASSTSASSSSLKDLEIELSEEGKGLDDVVQILVGLAHNTISLSRLSVFHYKTQVSSVDSESQLATMLRTNVSLTQLDLWNLTLSGKTVRVLFSSLEGNTHLTSLSLPGCGGTDWPSATFVLDTLRVNGILHDLDLWGTPLAGKSAAAIRAQLARNGENAAQVQEFKSQGSDKVAPTSVRLFLCGLPYSGKTTLSRSLLKWNATPARSCNCITSCSPNAKSNVLDRTRGIEITTLERDGVKMSLWDMAGQPEYLAFQDYMFPNLSNEAIPSLFLFVWNPIQGDAETGRDRIDGKYRTKTPEMFKLEFQYWLRFISSKSLKSIKFKPTLFVVITRRDLLEIDTKEWFVNAFDECKEIFKERIEFARVFKMDARYSKQVEDLGSHIFDCAEEVLKMVPSTYQACNFVRTMLLDIIKPTTPILRKEDFFSLCKKRLGLDNKDLQEAVALTLNDSGDIIYFKSVDLVLINTHWFCHDIMGRLLGLPNDNDQCPKGHFPVGVLQKLLEGEVGSNKSLVRKSRRHVLGKAPKIEGQDLVKLLIGLRLACQQDESSHIFIPSCLSNNEARRQLHPCNYFEGDRGKLMTFIGRRLKCKDSICTFFTPGIISLLQNEIQRRTTMAS